MTENAVLFAVDEDNNEDFTITWRHYGIVQKEAVMKEAATICDFLLFRDNKPTRFEGYQFVLDLPFVDKMMVYEGKGEWTLVP